MDELLSVMEDSETNPKCFEYGQDIALIHGAFISAHKQIKMSSNCEEADFSLEELSDYELIRVGQIIYESLNIIVKKLEARTHFRKDICKKSTTCRRINAAILYTVMKSNSICCAEADEYFACIDKAFPKMSWKLYFYLQKICHFQLLFFDQMIQLLPSIAVSVLQQALQAVSTEDDCDVVLDSIVQVLVDQLVRSKSVLKSFPENVYFDFPFQVGQTPAGHKVDNAASSCISAEDLVILFDILKKQKIDLNILNVILNGLCTLLSKVIHCMACLDVQVSSDAVKLYLKCTKDILSNENAKSCMSTALRNFKGDSVALAGDSVKLYTGLDSLLISVVFMLYGKLDIIMCSESSEDEPVIKRPSWLDDFIPHINELCKFLPSFPLSTSQESMIDIEEYIKFLIYVTDSKSRFRAYGYKLLVRSPEFLMRQDVISCVEKHCGYCTTDSSVLISMMESILKIESSKRNPLIEVFVAIFNLTSVVIRKTILKYLISTHGITEIFKLPYFETVFRSSNKNINSEQVTKFILSVCLQSPEKGLQMITEKMFDHGLAKIILKGLREVDFLCGYQESKGSLPMLIKVLKPYFDCEIVVKKKAEQMSSFVQDLLEIFYDVDVFPVNKFVESCILCNLHKVGMSMNMDHSLTLLNVVFMYSLLENDCKWITELPIVPVIVLLCFIISTFTNKGMGFQKISAISALNTFIALHNKVLAPERLALSDDDKNLVKFNLQKMHPSVQFYLEDLIGSSSSVADIKQMNLSNILCWYAAEKTERGDTSILERHLVANYVSSPRTALVLSIVQILPRLTAEEILRLANMLTSLNFKFLQDPAVSSENISEEEGTLVAVISIFIDSIYLLMQCGNIDLNRPFIISSFVKIVQDFLNLQFSDYAYIKIFLELCRLSEKVSGIHDQYNVIQQKILGKLQSEKDLYRSMSSVMYNFQ